MELTAHALSYEERLTDASTLPTRHTELEVELPSAAPWVGRARNAPEESIAIAIEVKHHEGEFAEVTRFGPFDQPMKQRFEMPRAPEEDDLGAMLKSGRRRSVFRLRLIHVGRFDPRCRMRVVGL